MRVNRLLPQHGMPSGFSPAPGTKAEDYGERGLGLRLLPAGTGNVAANSGAPILLDPSTCG